MADSKKASVELVPVRQAIVVRSRNRPSLALAKVRGKYWFDGEPHIKLRGHKLWWFQTVDGVRYREPLGYGPDPAFEEAVRTKVQQLYLDARAKADGIEQRVKFPTVQAWYDEYFLLNPKLDDRVKAFVDEYGDLRMNEVRKGRHCKVWVNKRLTMITRLGRPYARNTVHTEAQALHAMFAAGIDEHKLPMQNPWNERQRKKKFIPKIVPRQRFLSPKEQELLEPQLKVVRRIGGRWARMRIEHEDYRWVMLILGTGLRHQEFLDLRPCDVDLVNGWVHVVSGKGDKARSVPANEDVLVELEAQRHAKGLAKNATTPYWTFEYRTANKRLEKACQRAGFTEPLTVHDLRRTYGTRAANVFKVDIHDLQEYMGHADISTTRKYYIVSQSDHLKRAAANIRVRVEPEPETCDTKKAQDSEEVKNPEQKRRKMA